MDNEVKIFLPKLGESIISAIIVRWLKKEGEEVDIDDPLVEVATDKVNSEIPSPVKGVVKQIFAKENQELRVGELLVTISIASKEAPSKIPEVKVHFQEGKSYACPAMKKKELFLSPAAKVLVDKNNLSLEELGKISPTGAGGRISRGDIEKYLKSKDLPSMTKEEAVKMTSMRKAIASSMVKSTQNIPSASLISEIDVTDLLKLIQNSKEEFLKKNGFKLTITSFLIKALAESIKSYPYLNATLVEDTIYLKKEINIGLAVNVDQGLVVPVITDCGSRSITELARSVDLLGKKARGGTLSPDDIQSGTITMSNFGMGGALISIPIIKHPEAAIVGIGAIIKKVMVMDDDTMAIRSIMNVSLTFDHRIIDGMYGCNFMQEFKNYLEHKAIHDFS
jgi:2-oxoglutarate dehydrogenase E2 component (dihydrolipoamide succinyltransferase)